MNKSADCASVFTQNIYMTFICFRFNWYSIYFLGSICDLITARYQTAPPREPKTKTSPKGLANSSWNLRYLTHSIHGRIVYLPIHENHKYQPNVGIHTSQDELNMLLKKGSCACTHDYNYIWHKNETKEATFSQKSFQPTPTTHKNNFILFSSWWFQPILKIWSSKWVHLPQFSGRKFQKSFKPQPSSPSQRSLNLVQAFHSASTRDIDHNSHPSSRKAPPESERLSNGNPVESYRYLLR